MRLLLITVIAAAALWSGYWWFGSRTVELGLRSWLDSRTSGWTANYGSIRTQGFPNRFDTIIDGLEITGSEGDVIWAVPQFQILRLSYRPNHVIMIWPDRQTITIPQGRIMTVDASQANASLVLQPGTDLRLDRATAVFENMRLESSAGWSAEAGRGGIAAHASDTTPNAVRLGIEAEGLHLDGGLWRSLAATGSAPDAPVHLKLDAELEFDTAWSRESIETHLPALTALRLDQLQTVWGELEIRAVGDLRLDVAGLASGQLNVTLKNWRDMLLVATAAGRVSDDLLSVLELGAEMLSEYSAVPETLEVPLTLRRGQVSVGPFLLGTLSPLRIR